MQRLRSTSAGRSRIAAALLAVVVLVCTAVAAQPPPSSARVIVSLRPESRLLLLSKEAAPVAQRAVRAKQLGDRVGRPLTPGTALSERAQVVFATGVSSQELAALLSREPDVEYAVPDERRRRHDAPNDPLYASGVPGNGPLAGQWYLRPPAGELKAAIDAEGAWRITTGDPGIVVAVLDTGVRFEHPDLRVVAAGGNLLPGYDFIGDPETANDGDGRDADASDPGDWITEAEDMLVGGRFHECGVADSSWHGTAVAGVIGALTNNGIGMASVGRTVRILPVRVLGKCGGFDSDIIAGMRWAAGLVVPGAPTNEHPARVVNLSLGSENVCTAAYQQAISELTAAGTVVVASAGNSVGHAVGVPANCVGAIAVAGLRHVGTKVGFSDLGSQIAISAPAGNCVNVAPGTPCLYPILTTSLSGETTPGTPIYTDSFNISVGTSFAAPLVSGTVALMLSARGSLTPQQVRQILQATARVFPTTGGDNGDGTVVPRCTAPQFNAAGEPIDQLQCYCTTTTCGAGMLDAASAVLAASTGLPVAAARAQGVWWAAPAGSESGWGLNLAQQGDVVFATWFTYDAAGQAWWLSMTATKGFGETYSGTLFESRGPPFSATPFDPAAVTRTAVGQGTVAFLDVDEATFGYTVNGVSQSKRITRVAFGDVPTCTWGLQPDQAAATNYQDLWWAAPAASEAGWGINLVQQGDVIFATWFTYDSDGTPLWLSMTASRSAASAFTGTLFVTTGPPFHAAPFRPADVRATAAGMATLTFANGNAGTFAYTLNGVTQSKAITRIVFNAPGTVCR